MVQRHLGVMKVCTSRWRIGRVLVTGVGLLLVASACTGSEHAAQKSAATAATAVSSTPTTSAARPAGASAAPARFTPGSFAAVSDRDYWLLGLVPCQAGRCHAILHTSDGGRSFATLRAPQLPENGIPPMLRFANRLDGFAYVPQARGVLYATHDGGASWQRLALGDVLAFATAEGRAYAVTARCSLQRCTRYRFERARVAANRWTVTMLPFAPEGSLFGLAALGSKVWLLGTRTGKRAVTNDELARSRNGGRTFVTGRGPCYAGLGGELTPTSSTVVWAVCPGGLLGSAWRSTDGGVTFTRLKTPPLANSARLAPASAQVAVLDGNSAGSHLFRTTDGGRTWKATRTPAAAADVGRIGFSSTKVGTALVHLSNGYRLVLWRTTDGGARWSEVRLP
jgi:photosystem II stability/assembly factor-like uncharacterized protein